MDIKDFPFLFFEPPIVEDGSFHPNFDGLGLPPVKVNKDENKSL